MLLAWSGNAFCSSPPAPPCPSRLPKRRLTHIFQRPLVGTPYQAVGTWFVLIELEISRSPRECEKTIQTDAHECARLVS